MPMSESKRHRWLEWCKSCGRNHVVELQPCSHCGNGMGGETDHLA